MKKSVLFFIIFIFIVLFGAWFITKKPSKKINQILHVTTSFYPLYFFAREIGGGKATITNITPAGAEPHDYEPSTGDIAAIEKSNILILNGGGLEAWGDKIKDDLKGKKTTIVVAGDGLIHNSDPHVWLDPVLARQEAQSIETAFEKADPANTPYYQANMHNLGKKFDALHVDFQKGLSSCGQKNIVSSHAAFGYIAAQYNLKQTSIAGLSPDSEPSPQKLAEIAQFTKTNTIKYIFFESLVSPRLAEIVARETGASTIAFNPLEGLTHEEEIQGKDYFLLQEQNLATLKVALSCK